MTPHVLNLDLESLLGALVGALEGHVLEEVGGTVVSGGLVAGSGIDPNADGGGFGTRDGFGRDAEAGIQGGHVRGRGAEDVVREGGGGGRCRGGGCREGTAGGHPLGLLRWNEEVREEFCAVRKRWK